MREVGTVLVVDDEDSARQTLRKIIAGAGYRVTLAHDVASAIYTARERTFHVALVDQNLTGETEDRSGLTLAESLLAERLAERVIIHTAYGSTGAAFRAGKMGAFEYLAKPASTEEILSMLRGEALAASSAPSLERVVRNHCAHVVAACDGELTRAADVLGIHRNSLARILAAPTPKR